MKEFADDAKEERRQTFEPNYAMLGREVRLPCSLIATPPEETQNLVPFNARFRDNMRAAHERVRSATNRSSKTQKIVF